MRLAADRQMMAARLLEMTNLRRCHGCHYMPRVYATNVRARNDTKKRSFSDSTHKVIGTIPKGGAGVAVSQHAMVCLWNSFSRTIWLGFLVAFNEVLIS